MATRPRGRMLVARRHVTAPDPAVAGFRERPGIEDRAMHPVSSVIRVAELRSQELIAEAQREKLAEQAIEGAMHAAPDSAISKAQVLAMSLAVVVVIVFVVLVVNASTSPAMQSVATGP